jgi:hypothetical protein
VHLLLCRALGTIFFCFAFLILKGIFLFFSFFRFFQNSSSAGRWASLNCALLLCLFSCVVFLYIIHTYCKIYAPLTEEKK